MLQGVLGNTELALEFLGPDSGVRKYLKAIEGTSLRAGEIVKQMLAYSGKGQFVSEPVDMNELSHEMVGFLGTVVSKKAVIEFESGRDLSVIEADPSQMRQVVMNLIINASEALEDAKGTITIKTGELHVEAGELVELYTSEPMVAGRYVYLSVADDGCGMDETTKTRMFDPFFSTKFAGRGLGMAAVLGIMRAHKGALKVETAPGEGTEIRLLFPVGKAKNEILESVIGARVQLGEELRDRELMVLFADDEPEVLAVAEHYLSKCGCKVLSAQNGRVAVELFERYSDRIDIAVLDVAMPELDGNEAFRLIRREKPDLPVLMCSGYTEQHLAVLEEASSISAFLAKPYLPSVLSAKILELCNRSL
jgi:CheY-like chemotaxis protein